MKNIKTWNEFLIETADQQPDLDDQVAGDVSSKDRTIDKDNCVRCGEPFKDCVCNKDDYYSTININRLPAGKKFDFKTKDK